MTENDVKYQEMTYKKVQERYKEIQCIGRVIAVNIKQTKGVYIMRRDYGEGSVFERKDGLWVARYIADGKRKSLYEKTEKEVKKKLREYKTNTARGYVPAQPPH